MSTTSDPFFSFLVDLTRPWQRELCERVIASVRAAGPYEEHIRWGHPFFAVEGAAAIKLFCAAHWVNVYFYRGHEIADPEHLFEPDTNSSMRRIKIRETTIMNDAALHRLIVQAHALHSVGLP